MDYIKAQETTPRYRTVVKGVEPKQIKQRTPADLTQSICFVCWFTKNEHKQEYYVDQGTITGVDEHGRVFVKIPVKVKYHPNEMDYVEHLLFPDELGSTPEQAVENKV